MLVSSRYTGDFSGHRGAIPTRAVFWDGVELNKSPLRWHSEGILHVSLQESRVASVCGSLDQVGECLYGDGVGGIKGPAEQHADAVLDRHDHRFYWSVVSHREMRTELSDEVELVIDLDGKKKGKNISMCQTLEERKDDTTYNDVCLDFDQNDGLVPNAVSCIVSVFGYKCVLKVHAPLLGNFWPRRCSPHPRHVSWGRSSDVPQQPVVAL